MIKSTVRILGGWYMILAPIALWILLLTKPGFVWDGHKITIMIFMTVLGIVGGALILYIPRLNKQIADETRNN